MTSIKEQWVDGVWVVHYTIEVIGTGASPSDAWLDVSQQFEDLQAHADHAQEMAEALCKAAQDGWR